MPQTPPQPAEFGLYEVTVKWSLGSNGQRILESHSAAGPFTVIDDSGYFAGPCSNSQTFQNDPLNHLSGGGVGPYYPGQTYYFEMQGYTGPSTITAVSAVQAVTIPSDNGDTGAVYTTPIGSGGTLVNWPNPVQGFISSFNTDGGPYQGGSGSFKVNSESTGFSFNTSNPPGHTYCFKVQGYSQTGALGPVQGGSGAACATL